MANVIENLRLEKGGAYQPIKIIHSGTVKAVNILRDLLVEDCRNSKKEFGYLSMVEHFHKLIIEKSNMV